MLSKIEYYKPLSLSFGLILFGISLFSFGYVVGSVEYEKHVWWMLLSVIGFFIGEGFILHASSFKWEECLEENTGVK